MTQNDIYQNRWDSAKLGRRIVWIMRSGWITKDGRLTQTGEKMVETRWAKLSPAAQRLIGKLIEADYGNSLREYVNIINSNTQ